MAIMKASMWIKKNGGEWQNPEVEFAVRDFDKKRPNINMKTRRFYINGHKNLVLNRGFDVLNSIIKEHSLETKIEPLETFFSGFSSKF